jgi:DNA-binding CsgD family transcriptional regulator
LTAVAACGTVGAVPEVKATVKHHCQALIDHAQHANSPRSVFAQASERLQRLVPYDAAIWLATDPAMGMPTAPTRKENFVGFDAGDCLGVWEREFLVDDVNPYRELGLRAEPAAALRLSTGDRPARSARFREILAPYGLGDEVRLVCRAGETPWAWVSLFRETGRPAFEAHEVELLAGLSEPLGVAMRAQTHPAVSPSPAEGARGPGVMLFAPDGELTSVNDDAYAWLDELPGVWDDTDSADPEQPHTGVDLPIVVIGTLARARAMAEDRDFGPARARMRSAASGRWLVCHASCLRGEDGKIGETALVIEPAKSSEIAPIIAQACELSRREEEITNLIARGLGTGTIAERLCLSPHTVRDHVKAIFDKVGVSSRGELVASLFAEHYAPIHLDPAGTDSLEREPGTYR